MGPSDEARLPTGRLSGRVALVTGAARGIGRAICERLAADGAAVAINHLARADEAEEVAASIRGRGGSAVVVRADVSDATQVDKMVQAIESSLGPVTLLVNNAALTRFRGPYTTIDEVAWDQLMATNVKSCFLTFRAVHAGMRAAGWGRVINIGSVLFLIGQTNNLHYVTSKGAIVGFTRSLAREVGVDGITVNCVSPGAIQTEREIETSTDQAAAAAALSRVQSVPRRGVPADIAGAVAFLAGDDASFITGQMINVDGGWAMH